MPKVTIASRIEVRMLRCRPRGPAFLATFIAPTLSRVVRRSHAIPEHADPLHLELDDVAAPEPPPVAVLEDAAGADRARAEDVARDEEGVARGVRDDRLPRVIHLAEIAARALLA